MTRAILQQALDALQNIEGEIHMGGYADGFTDVWKESDSAIAALQAALAQPEPVLEIPNGPFTTALEKLLHQVIYGDFFGDNPDDLSLALCARAEYYRNFSSAPKEPS